MRYAWTRPPALACTPRGHYITGRLFANVLGHMRPASTTLQPVDWAVSDGLVPYEAAVRAMEERVEAIAGGAAPELVWLLEHPPLYTAGTSAAARELLVPARLPVHHTGRGGRFTYHGPGQRVAYVMLNVRKRAGDVRGFVTALEQWIVDTLACFGVRGETRAGRVGVWVRRLDRGEPSEDKIAAIGIRIRRWISLHGVSINVAPDLSHYEGIVPCGLTGFGVTSLADLGLETGMAELDAALRACFAKRFGTTVRLAQPPSWSPVQEPRPASVQ